MSEARDPGLEALLEFLRCSRGFDFTGYKRASLERRFRRRMETVGCTAYGDYLDYLEVHPDEYAQLFDTLLINVTEFFRDPPAWEHLRNDLLPELLADKSDDEAVRVWSAGCASGEEAYSVAIVLAELLGDEGYRERVKIYATDVDEDALSTARAATYSRKDMGAISDEVRERYFEHAEQRFAFRKDLRRNVIFGRNNLVQDAPISRLDVLICRNTLMYFNVETQSRVLRHFHFALRDHGLLMLGKSEMMVAHRDLFEPTDLKRRVFRRLARATSLQSRLSGLLGNGEPLPPAVSEEERQARDAALETSPHAQLIVSRTGALAFANLAARALFRISLDDVGRPFQDLPISYQPVELRSAIDEVLRERRRVTLGEIRYTPEEGGERSFDIAVTPLQPTGTTLLGVSVMFEDTTRYAVLQRELEGNRRDLELAYEELQSTIDELETTNEELQSANEELQTTNEELQSANEELETMNEELQSTNEELETINDELRDRTAELNRANDFLETILSSLGVGVAVLDRSQRVQVWNHHAENLWGVRADEAVEHHFLTLDIGLPLEQLESPLRAVLGGTDERSRIEFEAVNRRGRTITCTTTILPLPAGAADGALGGAIVLMEDGTVGLASKPAD
jgi:two-component system, chemotaxis family, CheB/CheR fusion protein